MESVPRDAIHWNMRLARVEESNEGLELHFVNGHVERGFDLIVGADGAFSKTRSVLTSTKPFYTGLGGWTMQVPDAETTAPDLYKFVNRGSIFAYSDGQSMAIQQLTSGNLWVSHYGAYTEDHVSTSEIDSKDLESVKSALKRKLSDWSPRLLDAIDKAEGEAAFRSLYMLPVGFRWVHKKGVTLIGDAAHLMTPFSGIGVNTAFYDAMLLANEIASFARSTELTNLDEHIITYEKSMFEHAHEAQKHTEGSMNDMLFTPGGPRTTIESWVLRHAKSDAPTWVHPIMTAVVYTGYFVYKRFV